MVACGALKPTPSAAARLAAWAPPLDRTAPLAQRTLTRPASAACPAPPNVRAPPSHSRPDIGARSSFQCFVWDVEGNDVFIGPVKIGCLFHG